MGKKQLASRVALCLVVSFVAMSVHAEEFETAKPGFIMGLGLVRHGFAEADKLREGSSTISSDDEIKTLNGIELYGEYFIKDDIALGTKKQVLGGGVEYSGPDYTLERFVELNNYILYFNLLQKIGSGFWRLGFTGGFGRSQYIYSEKRSCDAGAQSCADGKTEVTSTGSIMILGFVADWGEDGAGGRLGVSSAAAKHPKTENSAGREFRADASGSQMYADFRYAF